ncbi:MAG: heparosan-N-sulfate-glucuronate 5-epimerase [Parvicella sp.]|jgi:heparosan-N-sulfate-glucuronate 5-epimerase
MANMKLKLFLLLFISNWAFGQELSKYSSIVSQVDTKKWMNAYQRVVDSEGILTQKKQYHALSIAFYGIMAYNDFRETGDTASISIIKNQFKYFSDTSRVVFIDNQLGMGLPYHFKFHDLKAPWYSGMTQGVAISYLARYYKITNDDRALKIMKQLAYFMLKNIKDGGTIGKTPEGLTFIEEYPNSKSHPNVFNGFVNGLVGLNEYLLFFPKDTLARRIHDECYATIITTINKYDTPKWSKYDRKGGNITNHYMRYEIAELEQLYGIYKDPAILRQMMLWSYFAFSKIDTKNKHYKFPNYQFNIPFTKFDYRISNENLDFSVIYKPTLDYSLKNKRKKPSKKLVRWKLNYINLSDSMYHVKLVFDRNISKDQINIKLDNKSLKLDSTNFRLDSNFITINSTLKFGQISYTFRSKNNKSIILDTVFVFDLNQYLISKFGFHALEDPQILTKGESYKIFESGNFTNDALVFYRFADEENSLSKTLYFKDQFFPLNTDVFIPENTGYYEFVIIAPQVNGLWFSLPSFAEMVREQ